MLEDLIGDRIELTELADVADHIRVAEVHRYHARSGGTHRRDGSGPDSSRRSGDRIRAARVRSHAQEPPAAEQVRHLCIHFCMLSSLVDRDLSVNAPRDRVAHGRDGQRHPIPAGRWCSGQCGVR
jgi:hypothetical protein